MKLIKTSFISYLTLLIVIVLGIFLIRISIELKDTENSINNKINCVASYFNMPNRTGDTTLNCKSK